ncbi:hypothetical protein ACIBO5_48070 [Nonomuraea angiospora]|uniref:hypothetical protein n=1 Tax=Nonomuraea angiospora TaxID=46172 RepID=UPI00379F575E
MNTSPPTTEPDGPSPRPDDPDPTAGPAISARWRLSVLIMVLPAAAVLIFGFFTGASVSDMKPHAMPLGIAGPPLTAGDVGRQLATGQHGTFRIRPYTSVGGPNRRCGIERWSLPFVERDQNRADRARRSASVSFFRHFGSARTICTIRVFTW